MVEGFDKSRWDNKANMCLDVVTVGKNENCRKSRVIGSRRIFSPQFKIQVLDSYRNDVDCRGNQRATARKYNIHRRQIQKWLQCEQQLRASAMEKDNGTKKPTPSTNWNENNLALNHSAELQSRQPVAGEERTCQSQIQHRETKVFNYRSHLVQNNNNIKLESHALKLVAQKLYPRSTSVQGEDRVYTPTCDRRNVYHSEVLLRSELARPSVENFNHLTPGSKSESPTKPLTLEHREIVPNNSQTRDLSHGQNNVINSGSDENTLQNSSESHVASQNSVERSKPTVENSDGQKFCNENMVSLEESSSLEQQVPTSYSIGGPKYSDRVPSPHINSSDNSVPASRVNELSSFCDVGSSKLTVFHSTDTMFSQETLKPPLISPKRKWIQESLLDNNESGEAKIPKLETEKFVLPAKQRVKMMMQQGEVKKTDVHPKNSPNFTIEHLCSKPKSPEKPEATYPYYPEFSHVSYPSQHFHTTYLPSFPPPPPIIYEHRLIPDLVSLHFKPDIPPPSSDYYPRGSEVDVNKNIITDMKEEKFSDSEDDVDVTSTTPVENKSFEFGRVGGKRRSFSVQFKLQVLDAFYNDKDCNGNQRATARKFNINRRQVQKWLSQENELRNENLIKNGKYLQRQRLCGENKDMEANEVCRQCPQHCGKITDCFQSALDCTNETVLQKIKIKEEKDTVSSSTSDSYDQDILISVDNKYEKCRLTCCSPDNLSVHYYPYNLVCDWRNFDVIKPSTHFPCMVPYQPNYARV